MLEYRVHGRKGSFNTIWNGIGEISSSCDLFPPKHLLVWMHKDLCHISINKMIGKNCNALWSTQWTRAQNWRYFGWGIIASRQLFSKLKIWLFTQALSATSSLFLLISFTKPTLNRLQLFLVDFGWLTAYVSELFHHFWVMVRVRSKNIWVKGLSAPYLLRVKSMLRLGQGPALPFLITIMWTLQQFLSLKVVLFASLWIVNVKCEWI